MKDQIWFYGSMLLLSSKDIKSHTCINCSENIACAGWELMESMF
uniref:Uncharacterized protein n=1 Tax=Arundo donax TaxID=35708 RepID=A0A0A9HHN2_ARUDO